MLIALAVLNLFSLKAFAADYTIQNTEAIFYTNETTALYSDADQNTLAVPAENILNNLPVEVTGVTSNGFFQTTIANQVWYIPASGLDDPSLDVEIGSNEQAVYNIIKSQESVYPTGMKWDNETYYSWKGGIYVTGYGCAAFAFKLSDLAFGDTPVKVHHDYSDIKIGDILRINDNTHSVIVLEVKDNSVVVAEANYNGKVLWGRELSKSAIQDNQSYIMTRYKTA
jgi:hypothetical protein